MNSLITPAWQMSKLSMPCYSFYILELQNTCQVSVGVFRVFINYLYPHDLGGKKNQWPLPNLDREITSLHAKKPPGSWTFGSGNQNLVQPHRTLLFGCVH